MSEDIERRLSHTIGRDEFSEFSRGLERRLTLQDDVLQRLDKAIFHRPAPGSIDQPGLMITAQNIDNHINAVCNVAKWVRNAIIAMCGLIVPVIAAAHALGWI